MTYSIVELKELYLLASSRYFPDERVNTSIVSKNSKTTKYFIKLKNWLENKNVDPNHYIGFIFQISNTKPTPNTLLRKDYVEQYEYQFKEL